jgi:hypothetical protein
MSSTPVPPKHDVAALWFAIAIGAFAAIWTVVQAVQRILEIVPNRDVPVTAAFADTTATMPIGPGGAEVEVVAEQVVLRVSDMPPVTLWSLILAEVAYAVVVVVTVALVCLTMRNLTRGQAFAKSTVAYVGTLTLVIAVGWVVVWMFRTMGANGGAAALAGDDDPLNTPFGFEPIVFFAVASLGALAAAFTIGHKLQRDAEGLV